MNRLTIAVILVAVLAGAAGSYFMFRPNEQENGTSAEAADYYTCPMHPSVRSDRPGACPVCGMALVRKSQTQEAADPASLQRVSLSPTQRVLANVSTVRVMRRSVRRDIRAVGFLSVAEPLQATVAARFRGRIEKLNVTFTGASVRKGAALFELYSPDLISAEREYLIALESTGTMGRELLDAARDRLRFHFGLTEAQLRELEERRSVHQSLSFYSPVSGTVLEKNVREGDYVDEGMVLYRLADLSRVWAYVDVYEDELRFVTRGRDVTMTTQVYPGRTFAGRVTFVDPVLDPATRAVRVRVELPNPGGLLLPNMYVESRIEVPAEQSLAVPAAAVLSTGTKDVVWVEVEDNAFEPRAVRVGVRNDEYAQILSGVAEGERVAATGGYLIDSESALQMPAGAGLHQGHGTTSSPEPPDHDDGRGAGPPDHAAHTHAAVPAQPVDTAGNGEVIRITVKSGYKPGVIRVKAGRPLTLEFDRQETSACSEEIVFPTLDIRRDLPAFKITTIRIGPLKPGEVPFECGMGMLEGTLVVAGDQETVREGNHRD